LQRENVPYFTDKCDTGMKNIFCFILLLVASTGCIQKFQPSVSSTATGYLVVEGIINSGGGPATVSLSRTTMLSDSAMAHETGAAVQVEGNDNSVYPFTEQGNGIYATAQLLLSGRQQYRLDIKTKDGKQYLSDYTSPKTSPPIDSVNWGTTYDGVQVYVNTHDPMNNSIYYKWDYEETWEFHSHYFSNLTYDTTGYTNGTPKLAVVVYPNIYFSINTCWQTVPSSAVTIGSSAKLSSDVISGFPVALIPLGSQKLGVEYSILVKQYALTADAYNFYQLMKLNTEETGSIFSTQPSQLQGNIHCVSNPAEVVVGYAGFSSVQTKRIFIYNAQVPNWTFTDNLNCMETVYNNIPDIVAGVFGRSLLPTTPVTVDLSTGSVLTFNAAYADCVDCRYFGTNQQPSFWQ
jgi:uncharacterized protein DUF4249